MKTWFVFLVIVGTPLWVFRHDIIARVKGMDHLEYLDDRIGRLKRAVTFGRVKGSPEWCRLQMTAFAGWWTFVAIVYAVLWKLGFLATMSAIAMAVGCGIVGFGLGFMQIKRARRGFLDGRRIIEPVRRFSRNR
ncbi:hypothetical protein G3O06_01200 [Burkholderia sp. Ac-20345]|uniref:hypothetical protein n=1 Tax=Burkholderia sp. Ac-20345 TaxID=2703891 RepID=UPI00197B789F|nr:hypothetical protein [Burkholderia sp. Ac-20345]MBN3776180.1 hypothetical protein [Burkholderia sp. Ac-20345]